MDKYTRVAALLMDIEAELRQLRLWQAGSPSPEALASVQPFCIDTLTLPQWLQFVFLPRLYQMIEQRQALPADCGIAPMAEEYFSGSDLPVRDLLQVLARIDSQLSD